MRKPITMFALIALAFIANRVTADHSIAQNSSTAATQENQKNGDDAGFTKRVSDISWMPNGKSLLLKVTKIDKAKKLPPVSRNFLFDLTSRQFHLLPLDGSGLAAAPDGNSIAYLKVVDKTAQIYLYDLRTKTERPLVSDAVRKYALSWSPNGKFLAYNMIDGTGREAVVEVCVYSLAANKTRQITHSSPYQSYNPVWNLKNKMIVYYLEKGDRHDQIYLTDSEGSFSKNLTDDSTSHNIYPSWLDENTILYNQDRDNIMTMRMDGSNKQKVEGISSMGRYNPRSRKIAYIVRDGPVMLYDWKSKTSERLLDEGQLRDAKFD